MSRLVALYPAPWRARYEEEFLALLAERPPQSVAERADIVRGAIDARLHPQVPGPARVRDRLGFAVLSGFVLFWVAIALAATGPVHYDAYGSYRDGMAAVPFLIVAMVLLSAGLYRIVAHLPAGSGGTALAGSIAMIAGPLWGAVPWLMPAGAAFVVGTVVVMVGAARAGLVPRWSVVVSALALAIPGVLFGAALVLPWYAMRSSDIQVVFLIAPFSLVWLAIGGALLRGFAPTPVAPAIEPVSPPSS